MMHCCILNQPTEHKGVKMKHLQILKTPENVHPFTEAGIEHRDL